MKIITQRTALILGLVLAFFTQTTVAAQWQKLNYPKVDANIYYLLPTDKNTLWTYTRENPIPDSNNVKKAEFLTTANGGQSFTKGTLFDNAANRNQHIQPFDSKIAHLITADNQGNFTFQKTTDGGNSWKNMPMQPHTFPDVVYFWDTNNGVYVGDPDSLGIVVMYTTDSGNTYERVPQDKLPEFNSAEEYAVMGEYQAAGNALFISITNFITNDYRIWRTLDRGRTWTSSASFNPGTAIGFTARYAFSDANNGIALRGISNSTQKPLYTQDGGATWKEAGDMPSYVDWNIDNIPNTNTFMAFFQDTVRHVLYSALTNDLGKTWNTRKDVQPYILDSTFVQFDFPPFAFTFLSIVDNHAAWAQINRTDIYRYDSATPLVPEKPDLDLELTSERDVLERGITSKYTLKITNRGISPASGVQVRWAPPAKRTRRGREPFEFHGFSTTKGQYDTWSNIWSLRNLAPGQSALLEIFLKVVDDRRDVVQTAEVVRCRERDLDSKPGNMFGKPEEDDEVALTLKANSAAALDLVAFNDLLPEAKVLVSPNPASLKFNIAITPEKDSDEWSVKVVNSLGQTVFTQTGQYSRTLEVDTQNLINGLYFVEYQSSSEQKVEKVLVQH
jgi:hypothetical protein